MARSVNSDRACIDAGECRPRHRAKKDRKRWCGGKAGKEHAWEMRFSDELPNAHATSRRQPSELGSLHRFCPTCGRQEWVFSRVNGRLQWHLAHRPCRKFVRKIGQRVDNQATGPDLIRSVYRCDTCQRDLTR
jgi:hypothetical protein